MTHTAGKSRQAGMKLAAALALAAPVAAISMIAAAPTAHAQANPKAVNGIYQAQGNAALINEFKMDIFGGLEVTPIRNGKRYKKIIYRKVKNKNGVWEENIAFKKNRATYAYTNSGALVWTSSSGKKITLVRTGQIVGDTNAYNLEGQFVFTNNKKNINTFRMIDTDTAKVTPVRKGKSGRSVVYNRISPSEFKDSQGSGVYTVLPDGNLLWESRDGRNIRIGLTRK